MTTPDAGLQPTGVRSTPVSSRRTWSPRRQEIFDRLQDLFLAEGFRHLTIADLVDRLHCSRRTLYNLAPSREELILIVVDRLMNNMGLEANIKAAACDHPGEAIEAYLGTGVTTLRQAQSAFIEDLEAYGPTRHLYDRHLHVAITVIGKLIDDGISRGAFRPFHAPLIAEILDAAVERIRRPEVLARAGVSMSQATNELSQLIRHGLALVPADGAEAPAAGTKRTDVRSA
jgi:AcrR family transcriptional regulator